MEHFLKKLVILIILVSIATINFAAFFAAKIYEEKIALDYQKQELSQEINIYGHEYLDLTVSTPVNNDNKFPDFTTALKSIYGLESVKVYDTAGTAVFSENTNEINQNFFSNPKIKEAIEGKIGAEKYKDQIFEMYIPLTRNDGVVRAIVAGKVNLMPILKNYDQFILITIGVSGAISALLILSGYLIFTNAKEAINQKDRLLIEKTKALEEEQQQDEAILSSLAESLIVINKDGQILYFNPEAERITGYKTDEVEFRLYKNFIIFVDQGGKTQKINPIEESLKSSSKKEVTIRDGYFLKHKDGKLIPVSLSVAPILSSDQIVKGVALTIRDISAEKELDKVKDEFVYVVAHELGNPIFALDGYLSILEAQLQKSDRKNLEVLAMAKTVKEQLAELVNDLLEVVRNEQKNLKYELSPIDISQITREVIQNAYFKAKNKRISLNHKITRIPKVIGHDQKIKEVLTNLVDNAIKYTPPGGKVNVWHEIIGQNLVTHVTDNGIGISAEAQRHLFEKFYRVKTEKTAPISGTGLGLFICKQIVEKCGGKIWLKSEEDKGSTFSFSLTIAKKS